MNNKSFDTKRIAEGYARRPWLHKNVMLEIASDIGDNYKNGLDVGCGAGLSTKALKLICQKVTGTDISKEMIDVCKELYKENDYSFFVAKAEETPLPADKYDIVTAAGVINWVDRDLFLKNVSNNITEDGKLIIYDFWISNKMQNNDDYTYWYDNKYLVEYPKPPRNENIWRQEDLSGLMKIKKQKEFDVTYSFKLKDFIDYMMIQSNVNERIQKNEITEKDAYMWFDNTLSPIFNGNLCDLVFHGYYWILENL